MTQHIPEILAAIPALTTVFYMIRDRRRSRKLKALEVRCKAVELRADAIQKLQAMGERMALKRNEVIQQLGEEKLKNQQLSEQLAELKLQINKLKKR